MGKLVLQTELFMEIHWPKRKKNPTFLHRSTKQQYLRKYNSFLLAVNPNSWILAVISWVFVKGESRFFPSLHCSTFLWLLPSGKVAFRRIFNECWNVIDSKVVEICLTSAKKPFFTHFPLLWQLLHHLHTLWFPAVLSPEFQWFWTKESFLFSSSGSPCDLLLSGRGIINSFTQRDDWHLY